QWYVTISRGRKGVKIFTADKIQLRENVARSGDRTLALDMAQSSFHELATIWGRGIAYVFNVQHSQRVSAERQIEDVRQDESTEQSVKQAETVKPDISRRLKIRRASDFGPRQGNQQSRGIRI